MQKLLSQSTTTFFDSKLFSTTQKLFEFHIKVYQKFKNLVAWRLPKDVTVSGILGPSFISSETEQTNASIHLVMK